MGSFLVAGFLVVALAGCDGAEKKHLHRVLPANAIPYKRYSVEAHARCCAAYLEGDQGLRPTVLRVGGDTPHFTTLHGWLGGLGRWALGRDRPKQGLPFASMRSETAAHRLPQIDQIWDDPVHVSPRRYRSEARLEVLEAATRLLRTARAVAPKAPSPFAEWLRLTATWCGVTPVRWWARNRRTRIQPMAGDPAVASGQDEPNSGCSPCPMRSRSPPGGSR